MRAFLHLVHARMPKRRGNATIEQRWSAESVSEGRSEGDMAVKHQKRRRRRVMDPKKLKKRSSFSGNNELSVSVDGAKEKTEYGYIIRGAACKSFETYYEVMIPGTTTDLVRHEKKNRVIRVMGGSGFVLLQKDDGTFESKRLSGGMELELPPGTTYRVATTANAYLEFYVTQEAKYEARLVTVAKETIDVVIPEELLTSSTSDDAIRPRRRTGSKAMQQQQTRSAEVGKASPQVAAAPFGPTTKKQSTAAAVTGVNARPTGGNF